MITNPSIAGTLTLTLCAALVLTGCGKSSTKIAEKLAEKQIERESGGQAKVDIQGDSVKVVTKDGTHTASFGETASVPTDFPSDVPIYKGAKVISSVAAPDGILVTLQTSDAADKVIASYRNTMTGAGWTQDSMMDLGQQKVLALKKEQRTITVSAIAQDGNTMVMLMAPKTAK